MKLSARAAFFGMLSFLASFGCAACTASTASQGSGTVAADGSPPQDAAPSPNEIIIPCPPDAGIDADACVVQTRPGCYLGGPCLFPGAWCTSTTGPCGTSSTFTCQSDLTLGDEVDQCTEGAACSFDAGCGVLKCSCASGAVLCSGPSC